MSSEFFCVLSRDATTQMVTKVWPGGSLLKHSNGQSRLGLYLKRHLTKEMANAFEPVTMTRKVAVYS